MNAIADKAKVIFVESLRLQSSQERVAYLDEACRNDAPLRERVEALLSANERSDDFLEQPAILAEMPAVSRDQEGSGSLIGRYKLLELIGEGGFGDVYMAEQQEPVRRKVALKIIKLGMDTRQVIARFEAERQALALMDHPNIAKVLDAGATETGRPYFVMDLVRGWPITEYCDAYNLTTEERLRLFVDVCHALQHAHQKGIIHRDIKPNNVLVTQQDGKPVPKIIDFGVAKATEQRLTEKTLFTEHRQLIGTPEYMSPEQATFGEADVDTRSDIYSLGVLLYELLVGTTPFDAKALRSRGYDEICRVIRESDPPTPSKRFSSLGDAVTGISKHRDVEPAVLHKILRGDLDWIVMKCLEKDRMRRYETAHGLARDVGRHLCDEPVRARPPNTGYRLKKFIRKHRVAVAATAVVLAALIVGFARAEHQRQIATAERDRANAERERAQENLKIASQLINDVLEPTAKRMSDFSFAQDTQWEVLEKARDFYERIFEQAAGDPEPRRGMARINRQLGKLAWSSGRDAEPALRRSIAILKDLAKEYPNNPEDRIGQSWSHYWLAVWLQSDMRLEESIQQRRASIGVAEDLVVEFPSNEEYRAAIAIGNGVMGGRLTDIGKFDEAENRCRAAVTAGGYLTPVERVRSRHHYAVLLLRLARYEEAEQVLEKSLETAEQELAPHASPPNTGWGSNVKWLAHCHWVIGLHRLYTARFEEAERHLRKAIDLFTQILEEHPATIRVAYHLGWWQHDLAEVLTAMGRLEEAEQIRRESLVAWELASASVAASIPHGKGLAHYRLGELLHRIGRTDEAGRQFIEAQAIMEDLSRRRPDESACQWQLICLLANCPDPVFRDPKRAVALARHVLPESAGHYWRYLALAQYRHGQWQEAADSIRQAMDLRQGGDTFDWLLLAMAHWQLDQKEEALDRYTEAKQAIEANQPIFQEFIGVMAVNRLRNEAQLLMGERTGEAEKE